MKQPDSGSSPEIPLTSLRKGSKATVHSFAGESAHERGKLMALGVMPGAALQLLQRFPSYVIQIGYTQLALDRETAAAILVRKE